MDTPPPKIRIVMEGTPANGNNIPLSEFARIIDSFLKLLKETQKDAKKDKNHSDCNFFISRLSHSSPACLEIMTAGAKPGEVAAIFNSLFAQKQMIKSDAKSDAKINKANSEEDNALSKTLLKRWETLVKYNDDYVGSLKIESANVRLAKPAAKSISVSDIKADIKRVCKIRSKELVCRTSFRGWVEEINLHEKGQLKVYPRVPQWNTVSVNFDVNDKELKATVIQSIGKAAEISGMARYRPNLALPYQMKMEEMRILPDDKDLPKLSDLEGAYPNITSGRTVQEFMDDIRKGWER